MEPTPHLTDAELLRRTAEAPERFGDFYRRHARDVLAYLVRRTGDPEAGADLTAETFAAALIGARRFDPAKGTPREWLFGIAGHKLDDFRRRGYVAARAQARLRMRRTVPDDEDLERIEALAGAEISATVLYEALDALPRRQRDVLWSRVVDDDSYDAIADRHGVSPAGARQRVSRALAAIRHRLGDPS